MRNLSDHDVHAGTSTSPALAARSRLACWGPLVLVATMIALPVLAADLAPWGAPFVEPLRLASLPLETADGMALSQGEWQITVTPGYFNLWSGSWHTATIHREFGLLGQPLTRNEVLTLEQRHPGDDIYRFDLEGTLTEVRFSRGLTHGLTVSLAVPWLDIGTPHWDAISQDVHRALGWGEGSREDFARGQTVAFLWSPRRHAAIERWDDLARSGIGDVRLTLSGPLGTLAGGEQRWAVALEPPTGARGTLAGSGGWDAGVRWFGTWRWQRSLLLCALGYTRLDPAGSFLGVRRHDTWHALVEYHRAWGEHADWLATVRRDTSPLASFTGGEPGKPALFFTFGARRWLARDTWAAFVLGENLIPGGVTPDFSLQLQLGVRSGRRAE